MFSTTHCHRLISQLHTVRPTKKQLLGISRRWILTTPEPARGRMVQSMTGYPICNNWNSQNPALLSRYLNWWADGSPKNPNLHPLSAFESSSFCHLGNTEVTAPSPLAPPPASQNPWHTTAGRDGLTCMKRLVTGGLD